MGRRSLKRTGSTLHLVSNSLLLHYPVAAARDYALAQWRLVRISAHVFTFNTSSARVLKKNGFVCEGLHRKQFLKDGQFLDAKVYAFVR